MVEIWANIPGITGYQVSNLGRVRSLAREVIVPNGIKVTKRKIPSKILKHCNTYSKGRQSYVTVRLNGYTKNVHRLVALAFLGPPPWGAKTEVNHKDGNRHNNYLSNLEWCTKSMNEKHSYNTLRAKRKVLKNEQI
jgi:hypothetical protein